MTTRPLPDFDCAAPNVATQTRQEAIDATRWNLIRLYIGDALNGGMGWTTSAPVLDAQDRITSSTISNADAPIVVRVNRDYYADGPHEGLLRTTAVEYSEDGGATWAALGKWITTYTPTNEIDSDTWSTT